MLCNPYNHDWYCFHQTIVHPLPNSLRFLWNQFPPFPLLDPVNPWSTLYQYCFVFSRFLYTWNNIVCSLCVRLPSLGIMLLRFIMSLSTWIVYYFQCRVFCLCIKYIFCLSFPQFMDILIASSFWWLWIKLLQLIVYRYLCEHKFLFPLPESGIAESYDNKIFNFIRKMPNCSPEWLDNFAFPSATHMGSVHFAFSAVLRIVRPFICNLSSRHVVISNCGFSVQFLNETRVFMPRKVPATPPACRGC